MDVRKILQDDASGLLDDELGMLEEELTTGDYDAAYCQECRELIENERHARKMAHAKARVLTGRASGGNATRKREGNAEKRRSNTVSLPKDVSPNVQVAFETLSPYNKIEVSKKTPYETVVADVTVIRRSSNSGSLFREYVRKQPLIDEAFLDAHLSMFDERELSAILDQMQFSEAFLEKYLESLNPKKVATTQVFSEGFFMRHYAYFDPALVLKRGKNAWRKKENRSRKLDTFLRLKGVHD